MTETKQIIPGSGWSASEWLSVIRITIAVALLTVGIVTWVKEDFRHGWYCILIGVLMIVLPLVSTLVGSSKNKVKYTYPTASNEKPSKADTIQVILLTIAFAFLIIGFGVALSSALLVFRYGWEFAQNFLYFGLIGAGLPMLLLMILGTVFIK